MSEHTQEINATQFFQQVFCGLQKTINNEDTFKVLQVVMSLPLGYTSRKEIALRSGVKIGSVNHHLNKLEQRFGFIEQKTVNNLKQVSTTLDKYIQRVTGCNSALPLYISYSSNSFKAIKENKIYTPIAEKEGVTKRNNYPNWLTPKKDEYKEYKHNKPLGSINLENASVYLTLKEVENLLKRFGSGKDSKLRLQFWINQLCEYQAKNPKRFPAKKEKTDFYRTILEWDRRRCADGYEFGYHTHEGRYGFYRSWVFDKLYEESKKSGVSA